MLIHTCTYTVQHDECITNICYNNRINIYKNSDNIFATFFELIGN